jgi:mannose-1-phosphate guanylyltransferase
MHLILLSGGSGKRLWPLSNEIRSKQFLQLLPGPDGQFESMVQRVYRQLKEVGGWSSITVAAGAAQKDQLQMQLGNDVNIVIEPERRDTFPAIVLACSYLYSKMNVGEEEPIAILPVDPFVDIEYFHNIARFPSIIENQPEGLVLMGAKPSFPSEKYGYVVPAERDLEIAKVSHFKEKPNAVLAQGLIDQGGLWNCGVFGLRMGYILDILRSKYGIREFGYEQMEGEFFNLNKTSFDYEVVEHAKEISVLRYPGQWKDLGTWETLTEEMADRSFGNVRIDETCTNTHVINEQTLPVIAMGLDNAVVVASRDGILVAEKGETYRLKEFVKDMDARPMFEEKRWGRYTVLEHSCYEDGSEALTKKLTIDQGKQISYQYHLKRKEVWTILRGEGLLYMEDEKKPIIAGDVIRIEERQRHGIRAITDLEIIEVQYGHPLIEEDIVRLEMEWE